MSFVNQKFISVICLVAFCVLLVSSLGCGGMDENDIRRYAIKRTKEPEENSQAEESKKVVRKVAPRKPRIASADAKKKPQPMESKPEATSSAKPDTSEIATNVDSLPEAQSFEPKTPKEIAEFTNDNLKRVLEAIGHYRNDNRGRFPSLSESNLSWRVMLLPYLGYDDLYDSFDPDQPWNSPYNLEVAEQIPDEFKVPGLDNNITNVMMIRATKGVYRLGVDSPVLPVDIEDPLRENALLCLVKPAYGVVWSQPQDYTFDKDNPFINMSNKGSGYVVGMADGTVAAFPRNMSYELFKPLLTVDGGDFAKKTLDKKKQLKILSYSTGEFDPSTIVGNIDPKSEVNGSGHGAAKDLLVNAEDSVRYRSTSESLVGTQFWSAALAASKANRINDSWKWMRGAIASGVNPTLWSSDFKWVPAIRRPSYGLNVVVAAPGSIQGKELTGIPVVTSRSNLLSTIGIESESLLIELEKHSADTMPSVFGNAITDSSLAERNRNANNQFTPLTYLGGMSDIERAEEKAAELGADVLVYFDISYVSSGQSKQLEISVIDLLRRKRIHRVDGKVTESVMVPSKQLVDNIKILKWELSDFLEDELTPTSWPVKVDNRIGLKRIQALSAKRYVDPMVPLSEMRYYYGLGVIDQADLLIATEKLLGKPNALSLLLGSDKKRIRAIREWLPSDDPVGYVDELTLLYERQQDDDDD